MFNDIYTDAMYKDKVTICTKIVKHGHGLKCPTQQSECTIILENALQNRLALEHLFGCKIKENTIVKLGSGTGELADLLDSLLEEMLCETQIEIKIKFLKKIDENFDEGETIEFSLTLLEYKSAIPVYELSIAQCMVLAQEYKEIGTDLFKQLHFSNASKFYGKALKYVLIGLSCKDIDLDDKNSGKNMLSILHSNLAACQLKNEQYLKVVQNCTESIAINPNSIKTFYRRATGYFELKDSDSAEKDIKSGLLLEPNNRAMILLQNKLKLKKSAQDSELSQNLKTMFISS